MIKSSALSLTKVFKRNSREVGSIMLSFIVLYIVGNIQKIHAYQESSNFPLLKLYLLSFILFLFLSCAFYFLINILLQKKVKQIIILGVVILISFFISYQLMVIPTNRGVGLSYLFIGNYLRDVHDINIYYMDWAGWAVTMVLSMTSIFSAVLFAGVRKLFPGIMIDKK